MLKKFFIAFAFVLVAVPAVDTFAYSYSIYPDYGYYRYEIYDSDPVPVVTKTTYSDGSYFDVYARLLHQSQAIYTSVDQALDAALLDTNLDFNMSVSTWSFPVAGSTLFGEFVNHTGGDLPFYDPPEPDPPDPGSDWLDDMWSWFLWLLGLNDDFSGDIDVFITGGDRERMEIVTPTPSPTPTPRPSPTPYVLDIVDPNTGQPVYTITGIPGNYTYNYYEGDTSNGSDFDIFEVDLQVGDGGTSNPRDGINSVMDSNYDYLDDVDITPVSGSFSVLPPDWYILIGVLISFPVIAGFISKLLK